MKKNDRQTSKITKNNVSIPSSLPKLVFIGLSKAGKTSITNKFFFDYSVDEIKKLKPTLLFTLSAPTVEKLKRQVTIYDLGGQKEFIQEHLKNKSIFVDSHAIIIVIDIQAPHRSNEVELFVNKLKELLENLNEKPEIFVFLHKHDPDKREDRYIYQSIITYMNIINSIFGEKPKYHLTSIFDHTIYEAMIKVLFLIIPDSIISDMDFKGIAKAYPLILKSFLQKSKKVVIKTEQDKKELRQYAAKFGKYYLRVRKEDWKEEKMEDLGGSKPDKQVSTSKNGLIVKAFPVNHDSFEVEVDCSVIKNLPKVQLDLLQEPPTLSCIITHGIIEGIANLIGYNTVINTRTCLIGKESGSESEESYKCEFLITNEY